MSTLVSIGGDTSKYFIAELVTSIMKDSDDDSFDVIVNLGGNRLVFNFPDSTTRDSAFDQIVTQVGTVVDITP